MYISNFDKEIIRLNEEIETVKKIMHELSEKFIKQTKKFLQKRAQDLGDKIAKIDHPERTKQLGRQGLRRLKLELEKIVVYQIPDQVDILLSKDKYWLHRQPYLSSYPTHRGKFKSRLENVIRGILGLVGELFKGYKFKLAFDEWRKPKSEKGLNYIGNDILSPKMERLLDDYLDHYTRLEDYHSELDQIRKEKIQAEAKALWDEE